MKKEIITTLNIYNDFKFTNKCLKGHTQTKSDLFQLKMKMI